MSRLVRKGLIALLTFILLITSPIQVQPPQLGYVALATPATNQTVRCADLVANTGSGLTFTWAGATQTCSDNNQIITRATFVSWIKNNGSCAGGLNSTYYVMTWGDMLNCKINYTQHFVTIAPGSSSGGINCTVTDPVQGRSSCTGFNGNQVTVATLSSSTVAPTSSSTAIGISLSGLSYTVGCGPESVSLEVDLYNSGGTNVFSGSTSSASYSASYFAAGASAGTYTWKVTEITTNGSLCATVDGGAGSSYADGVSWTGTNASSYY